MAYTETFVPAIPVRSGGSIHCSFVWKELKAKQS
jgi:hypothetical protein